MQIILLERVEKLGTIGDEVTVKNGFARNYLIPQGKALIANKANRARFESDREAIMARNAEAKEGAEFIKEKLQDFSLILIRQSGETGQLYGSVSARDIAQALNEADHKVTRSQIRQDVPIKTLGLHEVTLQLHAEVSATIQVNVARTNEEAERQAEGENIIESLAAEQKAIATEQAGEMAEAAAEMVDQMAPDEEA